MTTTEGNPTRDALAALAEKFQEIAASTGDGSETYRGYKLAMEHAARWAWTAADEANEPEDAEEWWQAHLQKAERGLEPSDATEAQVVAASIEHQGKYRNELRHLPPG